MNSQQLHNRNNKHLPDQIVLLGDSIFDNAPYVNLGESVSEQLTNLIQTSTPLLQNNNELFRTQVDLLAVDGHVMSHIPSQLKHAKPQQQFQQQYAFVSCGGNDLLGYNAQGLLAIKSNTIEDSLNTLYQLREQFRIGYQMMLDAIQQRFNNLTVCTIYDGIPNLSDAEKIALGLFNEVILREAAERKLSVIDLRVLCDQDEDYAPISPIEPSKQGARKIAQAIYNQYHTENNTTIGEIQ